MSDKGKTVPTRYTYAGKGEPAPFDLEDDGKPGKCECFAYVEYDGTPYVPHATAVIDRCDWCKGLEVDVAEHKDTIAGLIKKVVRLETELTRLRDQRDAERGEVARLRERLEVEMGDNDKQIQAAKAVCDHDAEFPQWQSDEKRWGLEHEKLMHAYLATQKGGG